ncbi:Spy/CpxP family protein refolding chaperone [Methylobacter sp. sgz302048]|uniref:Spy/CpxP family protein refolding chaperone n=1 Tax=Methylobacter sp. sgz302048 TaxID=3455945 RepID=UPI003FA10ACB
MNKKIITIAIALALPFSASAGAGAEKEGFEGGYRHGEKMERMAKELNLNEEQKTKMDALFKEQHEKYKSLHEETRTRLKEILTPEQMQKMDEIKKRHHEQWKSKRGMEKQK